MGYSEMMRATAMQVSLAWQLFPFIGPIVGKLAEHANNPPTYYRGTTLKCFWPSPNLDEVKSHHDRKMSNRSKVIYYEMLTVAFVKDRFIPIMQRFSGVGMYVIAL